MADLPFFLLRSIVNMLAVLSALLNTISLNIACMIYFTIRKLR